MTEMFGWMMCNNNRYHGDATGMVQAFPGGATKQSQLCSTVPEANTM